MVSKEIYIQGDQKRPKSESRRSPPYDAAAVDEALRDAVDETMVSHAFTIVEKYHDEVSGIYIFIAQAEKKRQLATRLSITQTSRSSKVVKGVVAPKNNT